MSAAFRGPHEWFFASTPGQMKRCNLEISAIWKVSGELLLPTIRASFLRFLLKLTQFYASTRKLVLCGSWSISPQDAQFGVAADLFVKVLIATHRIMHLNYDKFRFFSMFATCRTLQVSWLKGSQLLCPPKSVPSSLLLLRPILLSRWAGGLAVDSWLVALPGFDCSTLQA